MLTYCLWHVTCATIRNKRHPCQFGRLYGRVFVMSSVILMVARYAIMLLNRLHLPVHLLCLQLKLTCACLRKPLYIVPAPMPWSADLLTFNLAPQQRSIWSTRSSCFPIRRTLVVAAAACNVQPAATHSLFLCLPPSLGRCANMRFACYLKP